MDAYDIALWIQQNATKSDLEVIHAANVSRQARIHQEVAWTLRVGDKVTFKPRKTMPAFTGVIEKINPKRIIVRTESGRYGRPERWNMFAENLTKIEA